MANEKKSFMLYYDYREQLALLTDEERGRLLMAILDYGETGAEPELEGATRMAFSFIRAQMDRDAEKWEQTRQARARAGQQGGLRSGQTRRAAATSSKQDEANEASASSASEEEAEDGKGSVTDTVEVTGTVTEEEGAPLPPKGASSSPVPFEKIMQLYNATCKSFPKIKIIDGQRRKAVAARWHTYHSLEIFTELFEKAEASDFMRGVNDKGWAADFDWIMRPTNMAKVLEGKYDNDRMKGGGSRGEDRRDNGQTRAGGHKLEGFTRADQ